MKLEQGANAVMLGTGAVALRANGAWATLVVLPYAGILTGRDSRYLFKAP